jgi:hypothetical protein
VKDRIIGITFFGIALLLGCIVVVSLISGLIEWLQSGVWQSPSLLQAAYDAQLIHSRWFLSVDWGWRVHEILDQIPLLLGTLAIAPLFWFAGLWFVRR